MDKFYNYDNYIPSPGPTAVKIKTVEVVAVGPGSEEIGKSIRNSMNLNDLPTLDNGLPNFVSADESVVVEASDSFDGSEASRAIAQKK